VAAAKKDNKCSGVSGFIARVWLDSKDLRRWMSNLMHESKS
jgi:hypothetical protein